MYVINSSSRRNRCFTLLRTFPKRAKNLCVSLTVRMDRSIPAPACRRASCANQLTMLKNLHLLGESRSKRKSLGYLIFKIIMLVVSSPFDICLVKLDHFPRGFMAATHRLEPQPRLQQCSASFLGAPLRSPRREADLFGGMDNGQVVWRLYFLTKQVAFDLREGLYHEQNESTLFGENLLLTSWFPLSKRTWILTGTTILVPCLQFKPWKMAELAKRKSPSRLDLVLLPRQNKICVLFFRNTWW